MQVLCHIGVKAPERARPQPLIITLELAKNLQPAGIADDVGKTINYSVVCEEINNISQKEFQTIESFAEKISSQVKLLFNPEKIKVSVKKPCALLKHNAESAMVVLER